MHKVLLVDDEAWILKDLRHLIDWEKLGFTPVGEAKSYAQAETLIDLLQPDVIICDICIPGGSGLDLVKKMKQKVRSNPALIVFISAYKDFAYAREAVRLGALDYIMKPVRKQSLEEVLATASEQLKHNEDLSKKLKDYESNNLFYELMEQKGEQPETADKLERFGLSVRSGPYVAAIVKFREDIDRAMVGRLNDCLFPDIAGISWMSTRLGSRKWLYLINGTPAGFAASRRTLRMLRKLEADYQVSIGISSPHREWRQFREAYHQADLMADQLFISGKCQFKRYRQRSHPVIDALLTELQSLTTNKQLIGWIAKLEKCAHLLDLGRVAVLHHFFIHRLRELNMSIRMETVEAAELPFLYKDLRDLLETMKQHVLDTSHPPSQTSMNAVVQNVIREISERYQQKLLISDIAARFRMNSSYLSQLFKQEVGVSFTDFLVNHRLNKAAQLLRDGRFSIEEISDMVGYEDHIHFSKMFKKHKRITPAAYRKKLESS